jgi:hypothetical protein
VVERRRTSLPLRRRGDARDASAVEFALIAPWVILNRSLSAPKASDVYIKGSFTAGLTSNGAALPLRS